MKSSRKSILALCAFALGLAAPAIHAQDAAPTEVKKEHIKGERREMIKEELGLTSAQAEAIKQIREDSRKRVKALMEDASLTKEQRMAARKQLHEDSKAKIDALLSPEQRVKADEMRTKAEQMRKEHKADKAERAEKTEGAEGEHGPMEGKKGKKKPVVEE